MKATVPLFYFAIRGTGYPHADLRFIKSCRGDHRLASLSNATFVITDEESVAQAVLEKKLCIPVILITRNEFNDLSAVPAMKVGHPEFCPIHPGDVIRDLQTIVLNLIE